MVKWVNGVRLIECTVTFVIYTACESQGTYIWGGGGGDNLFQGWTVIFQCKPEIYRPGGPYIWGDYIFCDVNVLNSKKTDQSSDTPKKNVAGVKARAGAAAGLRPEKIVSSKLPLSPALPRLLLYSSHI